MWGALLFAVVAVLGSIATIWASIAKGRLFLAGLQHVTRADDPLRFWLWNGFTCAWCAFALWITLPRVYAGS
jgi:hypothetical protein